MTTKEDYINEYWEHIISDVSYNYYDDFGEDYEEQINEWAESYANRRMKENKEMNDKLTKYKRAFEILNRDKELTLHKGKEPILGTDEYKLSFVNWKSLTKEEYELLEELMNNENTK